MKDPERKLLGGFIKRWEERATLPEPFIDEAKGLVSDAFDVIIGLGLGRYIITDTNVSPFSSLVLQR